jgi:hypothetical protein
MVFRRAGINSDPCSVGFEVLKEAWVAQRSVDPIWGTEQASTAIAVLGGSALHPVTATSTTSRHPAATKKTEKVAAARIVRATRPVVAPQTCTIMTFGCRGWWKTCPRRLGRLLSLSRAALTPATSLTGKLKGRFSYRSLPLLSTVYLSFIDAKKGGVLDLVHRRNGCYLPLLAALKLR